MLELKIQQILDFLKKKNYKVDFQKETNQVVCILSVESIEFPLFIKIPDSNSLLQLVLFLPGKFNQDTLLEVSRLLHFLNKEIDLPGFGMDEISGTLFYRATILSVNQLIDSQILEIQIKSMESILKAMTPLILKVADGSIKFESILNMAREETKNE